VRAHEVGDTARDGSDRGLVRQRARRRRRERTEAIARRDDRRRVAPRRRRARSSSSAITVSARSTGQRAWIATSCGPKRRSSGPDGPPFIANCEDRVGSTTESSHCSPRT
jgi:hypothetical protein